MSAPKRKRRAGSNKSRRKQREYKAHCYQMRKDGFVTDAFGSWHDTNNGTREILGLHFAQIRATTGK